MTPPRTEEELRAMLAEATEGPFAQFLDTYAVIIMPAGRPGQIAEISKIDPKWDGDANLLAAAPDLARQLLSAMEENERLIAALDAIEKIAFDARPPNSYTPRIVQICLDAKRASLTPKE